MSSKRNPERGAAVLVVTSLTLALLAGGAAMLLLQVQSTRSVGLARGGKGALFCAEAGLAAASDLLVNNHDTWKHIIDGTAIPTWYPITGDIDSPPDNVPDFIVTIRDNDDETTGSNNPLDDVDGKVFMVSRCTKYPDSPRQLVQLIEYGGGGHNFGGQAGHGAGNTGNRNQ